MSFEFELIPKKTLLFVFFIQTIIYYSWFIYIFGILGHVCPVANLGMWTASTIGCIAFSGKRPRALGMFFSFIATFLIWGITFLFLHPNEVYGWEVEDPYRYINIMPFIMLGLNIVVNVLIQLAFAKMNKFDKIQGPSRNSSKLELNLERIFAGFSFIITIIIGIGYITVSWVKEQVWNDDITDWFDTVFFPGDVYRLFLFLAIIALFSGIMMGFHFYTNKKSNSIYSFVFKVLGYTFFGFLIFGTIALFIFLGSPQSSLRSKD